jgi:hypothetical protein
MYPLFEKSQQNLTSAEVLHKEGFHASSVHCSYYACVQQMLHIVLKQQGVYESATPEKDEQYIHSTMFQGTEKSGFHVNLIRNISERFPKDKFAMRSQFDDQIRQLKTKRRDADYFNAKIEDTISQIALSKAKNVLGILTKVFSV